MKQAVEFNLMGGKQKVVGLAVYISDIISLTSRVAKGAVVTNNWYWDLNDQTRAFSARFAKRSTARSRRISRPAPTQPSPISSPPPTRSGPRPTAARS